MSTRLCRYFPELYGGKVAFEERFGVDSRTPGMDYPDLTLDLCEQDKSNPKASVAVVRDGVLQLHRRSMARTEDVATTAKQFSGRMLVSVDLGNDAQDAGWVGVALCLGHLRFFIVPGCGIGPDFEGLFFVDRVSDDPNPSGSRCASFPPRRCCTTCLSITTGKMHLK